MMANRHWAAEEISAKLYYNLFFEAGAQVPLGMVDTLRTTGPFLQNGKMWGVEFFNDAEEIVDKLVAVLEEQGYMLQNLNTVCIGEAEPGFEFVFVKNDGSGKGPYLQQLPLEEVITIFTFIS